MKSFDIIPCEEYSENFFNIKPASQFIPEWYRLSKGQVDYINTALVPWNTKATSSTFKKCTPFFDAMTSGYIAYLTADIEIAKNQDGTPIILCRTERLITTDHDNAQWDGCPVPEGYAEYIFKWHNQFALNVPKGYSLLFTNPINRFDLPFQTITGVVDCDKYNGQVHFPFFVKNNFIGIIPAGTPIAQIIPIKREKWERRYLKYSKDYAKIHTEKFLSTIKRSYKNNYWSKKEYL